MKRRQDSSGAFMICLKKQSRCEGSTTQLVRPHYGDKRQSPAIGPFAVRAQCGKDVCAPLAYGPAGSRISVSLAAPSTADCVNGNARGVTLRQSSSWSFQWGLDGIPDSPRVIPCCVLSQSLGSAMKRIETLLPTLTVAPRLPTPF